MEDISFNISGILTEEEANQLFEEQAAQQSEHNENEEHHADEGGSEENEEFKQNNQQETVGNENNRGEEDAGDEGDGTSPNSYSSIADALRKDGIFPDFSDEEIAAVKTPEDFAELFRKAIKAGEDERVSRVNEALDNGVKPDTVKMYEETISYLNSIKEDDISAEGEEGENLRKHLIYNDLLSRGYSEEKATKELEKSFKSGSDIDDAKDALEALKGHYQKEYTTLQDNAKKKAEEARKLQKKQADDFKKLILEDEIKLGETVLDKRTCQKVFEAVSKPVYKTESGKLLTAVQKFQTEHPLEFLKQLGIWFVLTEGGKNFNGFTKETIRTEKNKNIQELARKINTTSLGKDGSLRYIGGGNGESDPLLSDGWKIGWE